MNLFNLICLLIFSSQVLCAQDLMKSIYFGGGSYYIDDFQIEELHNFINDIPLIHQYEIEIHGHTDDIGSIEYNKQLSIMRTSQVNYILNKMPVLKPDQIQVIDFGELNPDYDNSTMEGKLRNRRVDIIIKRMST